MQTPNTIHIAQLTGQGAAKEVATMCAEFLKQGVHFTVREDLVPHISGIRSERAYVITLTGGF